MYHFHRTGIHTLAAAGTLIVVNRGVEVLDLYRAGRALLLAYLTADTAVLAVLLRNLSVVGRRAQNVDMLRLGLDAYYAVRASRCALSAGTAKRRFYLRHAIHYLYGIVLADRRTVSETYTAVLAHSVAAVEAFYRLA